MTEVKRGLRVATVFKRHAGQEAGIQPGDVIIAVERQSIAGEGRRRRHRQIKGPAGTKVTLTVGEPRRQEPQRHPDPARGEHPAGRRPHRDGRRRASSATSAWPGSAQAPTASCARRSRSSTQQGAEGIVLDLRGNGGGLLDRGGADLEHLRARRDDRLDPRPHPGHQDLRGGGGRAAAPPDGRPDQRRHRLGRGDPHRGAGAAGIAKVVGTTSFGKGIFQEVMPLTTAARWS